MGDWIWLGKNVVKALVLPPTPFLLIALAALLFAWRSRWLRMTGIAALVALGALSTEAVSTLLSGRLEADAPPLAARDIQRLKGAAAAIVILGGGRRLGAAETPEGEAVSEETLARCAYGARLARATGLPVVVSGGKPGGHGRLPEAHLMERALREDFGVPVAIVEDTSRDTIENARNTARVLGGAYGKRVVVVTHVEHMKGTAAAFAAQGFEVVAAPMGHFATRPLTPIDYLPSAEGLRRSSIALREFLREAWYLARL
jgi:uncharacterized SAM-binding protein YcdF (DUF218 family)